MNIKHRGKMMTLYVEITEEGYLSIPKRSVEKMRLRAGMWFKLLTDEDDDVLVLRLVREEETESQIDEGSLLLQQQALKNIWDSEEEDIYEL
jgi:bifunctional DNA-binding transcriptional regulator/antitoxin component of YhaV-PrlF toxin-antitoxin module